MKRVINGFLTTLTTLTRLPSPFRFTGDFSLFGLFMPFFGIPAALSLWGVTFLRPYVPWPVLLALFGLTLQYWIFNLFHFDGLLDTADGFFYQGERDRRIEIMKDSRIGSYALFTGVIYLLAKVSLIVLLMQQIAEFGISNRLGILALAPVAGRLSSAFVPLLLKPAKPGGLSAMLTPYRSAPVLAGAAALSLTISLTVVLQGSSDVWTGLAIAFSAAVLITTAIGAVLPFRRIGGFTGDTLGATVEIGELICLAAVTLVLA